MLSRVIILLNSFILFSNVFCTHRPQHNFCLGNTQIIMRDTQRFDSSLEKCAFTKFIKGDYLGFSKDFSACALFGYSSIDDVLAHDINEIHTKGLGLDIDTFISSDTCGCVYYGLYNIMVNDCTVSPGTDLKSLVKPNEIIESPVKWLFGEGLPIFSSCGLLYEMTILRAAYIYANEQLNDKSLEQLRKMLDFSAFYKELKLEAKIDEAKLELEKHRQIISFFRNWVMCNIDEIKQDADLSIIIEKHFKTINCYELALEKSADSIYEFIGKNIDICDSINDIIFLTNSVFFNGWEEYCCNTLHRDICYYHHFFPDRYSNDQGKMADDLLREIDESGGNVHEDFIRFKEAIDEGDLFKAIKFEPKE